MGLLRSVASVAALAEHAVTMPAKAVTQAPTATMAAAPRLAIKAATAPLRATARTAGLVTVPAKSAATTALTSAQRLATAPLRLPAVAQRVATVELRVPANSPVGSALRVATASVRVPARVAMSTAVGAVTSAQRIAGVPLRIPAVAIAVGAVGSAQRVATAELRGPAGNPVAAAVASAQRVAMASVRVPAKAVVSAASGAVASAQDALSKAALSDAPLTEPADGIADLLNPAQHRRVWARHGRAYIQVRGLHARADRGLRQAVRVALSKVEGVNWAQVNAVTGEVLVAFDEGRISTASLVETVSQVEESRNREDDEFSDDAHPADPGPLTAEAIALASDWVAFGLATTGRILRWPRLPRGTRAVLALIDTQPRLRRALEARLGQYGTDMVLAVSNAIMHGFTQEPDALAVDGIYRLLLLGELRARQTAWCRREKELSEGGLPDTVPNRRPRAGSLPKGPIETYADRGAIASLVSAGGMLALSRNPGAAAEILLASVPRAAILGREAFGAILTRGLSERGVITLRGAAYRRLDRITAIVIDSVVLCDEGLQIIDASDPEVWRIAARLLDADPELAGRPGPDGDRLLHPDGDPLAPAGVKLKVVARDGEVRGTVTVAAQIDPLAEAVLSAARESGARVLLTEHAATDELRPLVDDVTPADRSVVETVRGLQDDGRGVLLVTEQEAPGLCAADVAVSVLRPGQGACWVADIVCGPGLEELWRLMKAVGVAHEVSARAARMALGGSALSALLVVTGRRDGRPLPLELAPVYSTAFVSMAASTVTAHRIVNKPAPQPIPRIAWHAMDPDTALRLAQEIRAKTVEPEPPKNPLFRPPRQVTSLLKAVGHELSDPLTPVLVLGAAASAVVGSGVDAALVGGVMTGNALISGIQRMRAEQALGSLLLGQHIPARVVKDGGQIEKLPSAKLRTGDIIELGPSDVVPADARLLSAEGLEVDEAQLTGESVPVAKSVEPVPGADLADRTCMVFEDTTVLAGRARAVVVATGSATQAGRAAALAGAPTAPRGIGARLNELTKITLPATGISGALVGALAFIRGVSIRQAISSGVSVAIAAVPEGLPLVATVAQLAAARRLARRGVLARSSRTLGTLGRVDVLCFDKTGTLTEGTLRLARLSGPTKDVAQDSPYGRRLLTASAHTCPPLSKATHATDRAILKAAPGGDPDWRLVHETPFEPSRGYSAAVGFEGDRPYVAVKGAPEVVLPRCTRQVSGNTTRPMTEQRAAAARARVRQLAEAGLRVLAVAEGRPDEAEMQDAEKLPETTELALLGFVGLADTLRPEAVPAIRRLTEAGVRVVMITGDHPATAHAIAAELEIPDADRVLTGAQLDRLSEKERVEKIAQTSVFARVSPEHKVRIVQTLQRAGRTVAMTGDGSNDAAAIRLADVGIGVSSGDSKAASLSADLILPEADLPGIVAALLEGRALWESVRNAVSILVGGNAGEVAFTVYGTAVGGRAPLSTRQLLLVNTLTDMMPALAVALAEPADRDEATAADPPGDPLLRAIALRGAVTAAGSVLAWHVGKMTGRDRRASTMGLAALVTTQLAQTLQTGRHSGTVIATSLASLAVLTAVIETPGVSQFFGCTPLGPFAWTIVLASAGGAVGGAALAARSERVRELADRATAALSSRLPGDFA